MPSPAPVKVEDPETASGPVEMVTVPALGPEWKASELRDLRGKGKKEARREERARKWKEWSVLLTGSQLLFHRDPLWAQSIQSRLDSNDNVVALNHASMPRPDEMYSVRDAVAVFDRSYTKVSGAGWYHAFWRLTIYPVAREHSTSCHA